MLVHLGVYGFVGKYFAHRVGGASGRRVVVVGVALQGKGGGGVPGEGLQIADGLAALGEEREARVPEVVEADGGSSTHLSSGL